MNVDKIIQILIGNNAEDKAEKFLHFLSEKLWNLYDEYLIEKIKMVQNKIVWNLTIPNAKENQTYNQTIEMPTLEQSGIEIVLEQVTGLNKETHGLILTIAPNKKSFSIKGTPTLESFRKDGATALSAFELTLHYRFTGIEMPSDKPVLEKKVSFVINQDPRKLWKTLPVDWDNMPEPKYKNEDTQAEYVKVKTLTDGTPQKDIVAASKRGRSHAQESKPRDDHFKIKHISNGWYIMAVADGAGSAKLSREGSRIACEESVKLNLKKYNILYIYILQRNKMQIVTNS